MSWENVRQWRDRLLQLDGAKHIPYLSPSGAEVVWENALHALSDEALERIESRHLQPYPNVCFVSARTVATAPIEWLAVLMGVGSKVTIKHPQGLPGVIPLLCQVAKECGLHAECTENRACIDQADMVITMGSDDTLRHIKQQLLDATPFAGHGHRFSVAWITGQHPTPIQNIPKDLQDCWGHVAYDLAMHDGRGCLTPSVIFTCVPIEEACDSLHKSMKLAEHYWPRGVVSSVEFGLIRTREALAQISGHVYKGAHHCVLGLPKALIIPQALPRTPLVIHCSTIEEMQECLQPYRPWISSLGTDAPDSSAVFNEWKDTRICPIGAMQSPPMERLHDGVDWIGECGRL